VHNSGDRGWVEVFDLRILSKNVDDLRLLPMSQDKVREIKAAIGSLAKQEKRDLLLWLQKELEQ
jgi:hypothetical protein